MLRSVSLFLVIVSTLSGCDTWSYTITKMELNPKAQSCTFEVTFPENYSGHERGKQTLTVTSMTAKEMLLKDAGPDLHGVGYELRHKCGEYIGGS